MPKGFNNALDLQLIHERQPLLAAFASLLHDARRHRATDIHLEPLTCASPLRYRVDGALREMPAPENLPLKRIMPLVKSLCGLTAENELMPGEGQASISHAGRQIEFNAAIFPTLQGPRLTIHLKPEPIKTPSLGDLRLAPAECLQLQALTDLPRGVLMVAGPAGVIKTTLLYALLAHTNRSGRSVMTIEDPIAAPLPEICQTAVQKEQGLTWQRCMTHVLAQAPDVLAVEVPPRHRAFPRIFTAAQENKLLLLQVTTPSAAHTLRHLLDSGLHSFQICDALRAIIAQRTARVLCPECKTQRQPELSAYPHQVAAFIESLPQPCFFSPVGCARCRHTGFESTLPLLEMVIMDDALRDLIGTNPTLGDLRKATTIAGLSPLLHNAILKASIGLISLDDIQRTLPPNAM